MRWEVLDKLKFWKKEDFPSQKLDQTFDQQFDPMQQSPGLPFGQESNHQFGADNHQFNEQPEQYPQQFSQYPPTTPFPGSPPMQSMQSMQSQQVMQEQHVEPAIHPRDVELILAKLDAVKSDLDALHQRVRKIEQYTDSQQQKPKYW